MMNAHNSSRSEGSRGTVLVVDDQPEVLIALQMTVRSRGYEVLAAASGPEALRLAQEHRGKVDVVVTDYAMPEMNGAELIQRLRQMDPTLQYIAISGNVSPEDVQRLLGLGVVDFLLKPFSVSSLATAIEQALQLRRGLPAKLPAAPSAQDV